MPVDVGVQDAAALEREARRLYDACQTVKPTWDQLGDTTKSVWREYAAGASRLIGPAIEIVEHVEPASQPAKVSEQDAIPSATMTPALVALGVGDASEQPSLF